MERRICAREKVRAATEEEDKEKQAQSVPKAEMLRAIDGQQPRLLPPAIKRQRETNGAKGRR